MAKRIIGYNVKNNNLMGVSISLALFVSIGKNSTKTSITPNITAMILPREYSNDVIAITGNKRIAQRTKWPFWPNIKVAKKAIPEIIVAEGAYVFVWFFEKEIIKNRLIMINDEERTPPVIISAFTNDTTDKIARKSKVATVAMLNWTSLSAVSFDVLLPKLKEQKSMREFAIFIDWQIKSRLQSKIAQKN